MIYLGDKPVHIHHIVACTKWYGILTDTKQYYGNTHCHLCAHSVGDCPTVNVTYYLSRQAHSHCHGNQTDPEAAEH